jgi:ABC-type transport system involved in multi-copper enzyme maturation permease subunit
MSLGAFIVVLTVAAAALALWTIVRFPNLGPQTLVGALAQVGISFASGWLLVPPGMRSALTLSQPQGPLLAVFLFALPSLIYVFLAALWAMRVLQQMLHGARR